MEASSTTVNIVGSLPTEMPTATGTHNHKYPNFGRYVQGCPACIAKHPDGPPAKKMKSEAATKLEAENEALKKIIAELQREPRTVIGENPKSSTEQLVQLMLADQAEKIQLREEEKARKALAREQDLKAARALVAQREEKQAACGHVKENGRSAIFQSQIHNDGFLHPFCSRCQKTFPKRRPSQEQMSTSVDA